MDPISRSAYGLCQGAGRGEDDFVTPRPATRRRNTSPQMASRSVTSHRGAVSSGNVSMICCASSWMLGDREVDRLADDGARGAGTFATHGVAECGAAAASASLAL